MEIVAASVVLAAVVYKIIAIKSAKFKGMGVKVVINCSVKLIVSDECNLANVRAEIVQLLLEDFPEVEQLSLRIVEGDIDYKALLEASTTKQMEEESARDKREVNLLLLSFEQIIAQQSGPPEIDLRNSTLKYAVMNFINSYNFLLAKYNLTDRSLQYENFRKLDNQSRYNEILKIRGSNFVKVFEDGISPDENEKWEV